MSPLTWRQRRAQARKAVELATSKDEFADLLISYGYAQDPRWSKVPLSPKTRKQKRLNQKLQADWGYVAFYKRRKTA